jgi:hypothetical protein
MFPQYCATFIVFFSDFNDFPPQLPMLYLAGFRYGTPQLLAGIFHQLDKLGGNNGVDFDQILENFI